MTVATTAASITYEGNGAATVFSFPFEVTTQSDGITPALFVFLTTGNSITGLSPSQYSVANLSNPAGGTITYDPPSGPIPTGTSITIQRALAYTQPNSYPNSNFLPKMVEAGLDWEEMQIQQLAFGVSTSLRVPEAVPELPPAAARPGQVVSFDNNGNPVLLSPSFTVGTSTVQFPTLVSAIATSIPSGATFLELMGYYAVGDGGGARYAKTSAGAGAGKFQSADGAWWIITETYRNLLMFGAKPDGGITDNEPFISAAMSFGPFTINSVNGAGAVFGINSNISISTTVIMPGNAQIKPANGVTVTIQNLLAPPLSVFLNALPGEGTVAFGQTQQSAYAEWWGAVAYAAATSSAVDSAPPIQAGLNSKVPSVQLGPGAYYLTATVTGTVGNIANLWMNTNGQKLRGTGFSQTPASGSGVGGPGTGLIDPNVTQLILTSPSNTGIQIGSSASTQPSQFLYATWPEDIVVVRATASVPFGVSGAAAIANPSSGVTGGPCGIEMRWVALCYPARIICLEHTRGFSFFGTIENFIKECSALRYTPGANSGNDNFTGFFMDNSAPLGADSGNASLYFHLCRVFSNVGQGGTYTYSAGIQSYHGFTDTFIELFETGLIGYGVDLNGVSASGSDFETEDMWITRSTFDSSANAAIRIRTTSTYTSIVISNCYINSQTNAPSVVLGDSNTSLAVNGSVIIEGCQFNSGNTGTSGIVATNVSGLTTKANTFNRLAAPVVLTNCENFDMVDTFNPIDATGAQAFLITGCTRGYIRPNIFTKNAGNYNYGVNLSGSGNSKIEVNVSPINTSSIGTNALISNGTPITSAGAYSFGAASGVF